MVKCVSFTKTPLLIVVREIVIGEWNAKNKGMLVEKKKVIYVVLIL